MKYLSIVFVLLSLLFISCSEDDDVVVDLSEDLLQEYFTFNNISPQRTSSGLYYVIAKPGSDEKPTRSSTVTVHYHGYFLNGNVFDSSIQRGTPLEISLRNVIEAWREGIPLYGKGGTGTLYVPARLGYGAAGTANGAIPPNTPLIFDVELIDFQ